MSSDENSSYNDSENLNGPKDNLSYLNNYQKEKEEKENLNYPNNNNINNYIYNNKYINVKPVIGDLDNKNDILNNN